MQLGDLNKPGEKKKLIAAGVLGLLAILFLWWTFVGFGSKTTATSRPSPTPTPLRSGPGQRNQTPTQPAGDQTAFMRPISNPDRIVIAPEATRNIFSYYEPPPPAVKPPPSIPTPTPPPPPTVLLQAVSPANVYARTGEFTLELAGDKFTPAMRIYVDQHEMPTKYKSPQQLSTTISAAMIATPGNHPVTVKTPDGVLFSQTLQFNVGAPPVPNYTFIGILSSPTRVDIAYLQDKGSKEVLTVQRGDVLSGRFRVTSISEKEVLFVDTSLKIRHNVARTEAERTATGSPLLRPTPRPDAEDDEP